MFQGIVFDLDDTLYQQQSPFAEAITRLFPNFPADKMNPLFIRFRHYSDLHYMKSITGEWSLEKMRYERIRQALADFSFAPSDTELMAFQTAYDQALKTISLPDEIIAALTFLKQQPLSLGIITNGPVKRQTDKLNALQLTRWFTPENILISDGVEIQKPDPAIFQLMEQHLRLPAESLLYIGDSYDNDVVGAKAAGWSVWWFNHQDRDLPAEHIAFEKEIKSFEELAKTLTRSSL
ncbi:HAD family hydrolase [Enterococcus pseudoavium]|uniref:HAD family hydrolase n=1 Tax=Enterococcus pseudoavium TaxID=44007 RepID=A0ABU3FGW5_9ENTE|nr:HAD family hydrolase [Enterococcus pseudoavium]MDT2754896.1 HAD family hydrolase [Enterococcus pseudoavium]MDT2770285.1 HAD family hydrolase [Enterococcus pseudoavium]